VSALIVTVPIGFEKNGAVGVASNPCGIFNEAPTRFVKNNFLALLNMVSFTQRSKRADN